MHFKLSYDTINSLRIHMVGIKGVGMTALTEILSSKGARITGSDVPEVFFTDTILKDLDIPVYTEFSESNINSDISLVIYSAAYSPETNAELAKAIKLNLPCLSYPEALGAISETMESAGIAGVHGKTTTTAMAGVCLRALGVPASVLVGSAVPDFENRATCIIGNRYFVAETCEYRRHFLNFNPAYIVLTSVEPDHLDYFSGYEDIFEAFYSYCSNLPPEGVLIYCADDPGANAVAEKLSQHRNDIRLVPYGFTASGMFHLKLVSGSDGIQKFAIEGFHEEYCISLPGMHMILDAAAAVALAYEIAASAGVMVDLPARKKMIEALAAFRSTRRRSEIIGETCGILFMDDYAHHPSAIKTTLRGLKDFYPSRRIVVDFMSHTYSRTKYLLSDFAQSFNDADMVVLHKIYASAREKSGSTVTGEDLFNETRNNHDCVHYFSEVMDAKDFLKKSLTQNDLFITMGAGDNWHLSHDLYASFYSNANHDS